MRVSSGLSLTLKAVNYVLSVLPMFILIGFIAYHAGLTHALFDAARAWFGWAPGGLAVAMFLLPQALPPYRVQYRNGCCFQSGGDTAYARSWVQPEARRRVVAAGGHWPH